MTQPDTFEALALDALNRAVADALERKRRLGQYYVVWQDGRAVCIGPDAPALNDNRAAIASVWGEDEKPAVEV